RALINTLTRSPPVPTSDLRPATEHDCPNGSRAQDGRDPSLRLPTSPALPDAILLTGGTGIGSRDQTFETIAPLLTKTLPGFGEIFRMLSYEEIGAAAMLSRAIAGSIGSTVVLAMPGSTAAVRLAMEKLILPEIAHLVREARR